MFSNHRDDTEREYFSALYAEYGRKMLQVAKICGEESSAEDNVQDALLHLMRHTELLKSLSPPQRYLYIMKTVQYTTKDRNKSESRRKKREDYFFDSESSGLTHEEKVELYTVLIDLPDLDRDILFFHYLWGYTYKEIATLMHIRYKDVCSRIQAARKHALKLLQGGELAK